jgi:hypothetical protein
MCSYIPIQFVPSVSFSPSLSLSNLLPQADLSRCHAVDALIGSTACATPLMATEVFASFSLIATPRL